MAEERRKSLDQADLDEHEAKTDQQKIERAETCQSNRRPSRGRQCRKDHREQHQQAREPTMISRVTVASRFPFRMLTPEIAAIRMEAGSSALSWLKKNGRSSVVTERSRCRRADNAPSVSGVRASITWARTDDSSC